MSEDLGTVSNITLGSEWRYTYSRQLWMKSRKSLFSVSRALDKWRLALRLLVLGPALTSHNSITQLKYTTTNHHCVVSLGGQLEDGLVSTHQRASSQAGCPSAYALGEHPAASTEHTHQPIRKTEGPWNIKANLTRYSLPSSFPASARTHRTLGRGPRLSWAQLRCSPDSTCQWPCWRPSSE